MSEFIPIALGFITATLILILIALCKIRNILLRDIDSEAERITNERFNQ